VFRAEWYWAALQALLFRQRDVRAPSDLHSLRGHALTDCGSCAARLEPCRTRDVQIGDFYLSRMLFLKLEVSPETSNVFPVISSLLFILNIMLLVISIFRTITELLIQLCKSSNAQLQENESSSFSI
jgi:hypothetical protein